MTKAIKRLKPDVQHFFDTNMFVVDRSRLPTLTNVPVSRRWVTATVRAEIEDKLGEAAAASALKGYRVLRFDELYADDPNVCPTFYAYVQAIFSPAVVGSDEFYEELLLARRIKNAAEPEDERLYEQIRRRSATGRATLPDGTLKSDGLRRLERHASATRKKIVATIRDGHPAVIRDAKNLALALYYCLRTHQNVILYTMDADPLSFLLRWLEAQSMRSSLVAEVLSLLGEGGRERAARGDEMKVVIPAGDFVRKRQKWFQGMVNDSYKSSGCRFTVKRWDQNARAFEDMYITFEKEIASGLAHVHGNMQCHFTKNNELGNWLHLVYEWPPADTTRDELRVTVRAKGINWRSISVSTEEHDRECLYRKMDADGRLHEWSQFV